MSTLSKIKKFQDLMEGIEIIKTTEGHKYFYTPLPQLLEIIHPKLNEVGLWYAHSTSYDAQLGQNYLTTIIYNIDDEEDTRYCRTLIDKEAKVGAMNRFMIEGSGITYFRRYHLQTLLGLTTDEDTDAGGKKIKSGGKSVDAHSSNSPEVNFVEIFKAQAASKTKAQFSKTFELYKTQMQDEDIASVQKIMDDKYGK